jgi:hypothetical protein
MGFAVVTNYQMRWLILFYIWQLRLNLHPIDFRQRKHYRLVHVALRRSRNGAEEVEGILIIRKETKTREEFDMKEEEKNKPEN